MNRALIELELFTGPECGLCDLAADMIYATLDADSYRLKKIDVTASLQLKKAYGLRIPVLRVAQRDKELSWPFDSAQLSAFVCGDAA